MTMHVSGAEDPIPFEAFPLQPQPPVQHGVFAHRLYAAGDALTWTQAATEAWFIGLSFVSVRFDNETLEERREALDTLCKLLELRSGAP